MSKGDPPVGRVFAVSRNDKTKKYEIGCLWAGRWPGVYNLSLATEDRKSANP